MAARGSLRWCLAFAAVVVCGCAAARTPSTDPPGRRAAGADKTAVAGKLVDNLGRPLSGWTVVASAPPFGATSPRATTDASGAFSIAGAPPAYDVAVVSPDASQVALFEGLTRRDLVLRDMTANPAGFGGPRSATLTGTLTGAGSYPLVPLEEVLFTFNAPEVTLQRAITQSEGPRFKFPARWSGPSSVSGRLVVLRSARGKDGRPEPGAFAFAEARVTLRDGEATSLDVPLRSVGSTTLGVQVTTPAQFPLQAITQFVRSGIRTRRASTTRPTAGAVCRGAGSSSAIVHRATRSGTCPRP
jgi:hypothetical protein